ncbi:hypothetical protein DES53_115123 [Roseimicrobium gellanilyticum]|uniref:Uncharacterized protein n=2 Tax=Roseimicrobium gellanilyticum TaxID=748857 RepID=A0A366H5R9_9BACT|nr:hypothetical protein DES53_115123 [Roseimicrobium gellanilyticum]
MCLLHAAWGAEPSKSGPTDQGNMDRAIELFSHALTSKDQHIVLARTISMDDAARKLKLDVIDLRKYEGLLNKGYGFYFFEVTESVTGFSKVFFYAASPAHRSRVQPDIGDSDLYPAMGTSWLLVVQPTEAIADGGDITLMTLPDIYDGAFAVKDDNRLSVHIPSFVEDLKSIKNSMSKGTPGKLPVLKTGLAEGILNKVMGNP